MKNCDFFEENARFSRLIKKYSKQLRDPQSEGELWGFLWLLLNRPTPPPNDFYIFRCLKNEFIRLSKNEQGSFENYEPAIVDNYNAIDFFIDFAGAFLELTEKQKEIILLRYCGFSVQEIGARNGISRQAVNKKIISARKVLKQSGKLNLDFF